jgi:hypothetical protein
MRLELLLAIAAHDGQWSWYQLDRALSRKGIVAGSDMFHVLDQLLADDLVREERRQEWIQPHLWLTEKGKAFLDRQRQEQPDA